jgi:hypothetical protein
MGRSPSPRTLIAVPLLAALLLPVAPVGANDAPAAACDSLPGPAPDRAPAMRDAVGLNFTTPQLAAAPAAVELCVLVDPHGVARELRVTRGGTPFDSAAVDAVRWWLFEPAMRGIAPVAAWTRVTVDARPPADADPVVPDVLELATDAEARGDVRGAMDAWTGALARVGAHPSLGNEWTMREHVLRLALAFPTPPAVPLSLSGQARGARNLMQRNIARGSNADYAATLDKVLRAAPWYADAYRWRAAARAVSGQRTGAMRDVLCYRLGSRDSAQRALADRALAMLATGDTLGANSLLKN